MSKVKINTALPKKDLQPGDFVFIDTMSGDRFVGMIFDEHSNGIKLRRVIWNNSAQTSYDSLVHLPFIGALIVS